MDNKELLRQIEKLRGFVCEEHDNENYLNYLKELDRRIDKSIESLRKSNARLAQKEERCSTKASVAGSSPVLGAIKRIVIKIYKYSQ